MDKEQKIQILGKLMSDLCEDCWCAGWLQDAEEVIPFIVKRTVDTGIRTQFGQGFLSVEEAYLLSCVAKDIGCWANYGSGIDNYVAYTPKGIGRKHRKEQQENESDV